MGSFPQALLAISSMRRVALHSIVSSDLNHRRTGRDLLHRHDVAFFSRLVVRIQRTLSFDGVDFVWILRPSPLLVGRARVVIADWSSLRGDPHDLRLVSSSLEVRAVTMRLWALLTSYVLPWILVQFEVSLRAATSKSSFIAALELILLVSTAAFVMLLQSALRFSLVENHRLLIRLGLETAVWLGLDGALVLVTRISPDVWE